MNEEIVFISLLNQIDISLRLGIEIKVAYFLCKALKNHWVAHFPKGQGSTLEKFLNSKLVVLEEHVRSGSIIGHGLENGLLNVFLLNNLLIPSVEEATILFDMWMLSFFDTYFEHRIGVAIESLDVNVIH